MNTPTITVSTDRESVCMASDAHCHIRERTFEETITMEELIRELAKALHDSGTQDWASYSGEIRLTGRKGNWYFDKNMTAKDFFKEGGLRAIYFSRDLHFSR